MKPELTLLCWSVLLAVVHMVISAQALVSAKGLNAAFGNREGIGELPGWAGRAVRANDNMAANLPLFAAAVLLAAVLGTSNSMTLLGAQIFFYGRVVYALCYLAGIKFLRTLSWLASIAGIVLILLQLK